jgi:hypothetical protein
VSGIRIIQVLILKISASVMLTLVYRKIFQKIARPAGLSKTLHYKIVLDHSKRITPSATG